MRRISFKELGRINYSMKDLSVFTWYWKNGDEGSHEQDGRPDSNILYLLSGRREYYENGECVSSCEPGVLNFIPVGHRYTGRAVCGAEGSYGYGFMFNLYDEDGELLCVDEPYRQVAEDEQKEIYRLCMRLGDTRQASRLCSSLCKACAYELLSMLCGDRECLSGLDQDYQDIAPAIREISAFPEKRTELSELCRMCNMSESSFRRRFMQFSGGLSPVKYRNRLLCEKAEQLYRFGNGTLEEIAAQLGFCDAAYLCRVYKQTFGINFRRR